MRIKSILLLLVCFLLYRLNVPAIACPPGDCDDCETWIYTGPEPEDGYCDWDCSAGQCCEDDDCVATCSGCYKCVDNYCEPCKCWDDGTPILGSITVQDAKLCEQVTHTSSISDADHWFQGGNGGGGCEGNPSDTISTYSWSKIAGDNPETGTFIGDTDEDTVEWQAPPCKGTVIIKLTADDAPDSMDNPCPNSERNDDSEDFEVTSTVSLPTGCTTGTKSVSLGSHDEGAPPCPSTKCGETAFNFPWGITAPNGLVTLSAKYNECKWTFQVTADGRTDTSACPSNYTNVKDGDESGINESNYCTIVNHFKNVT
jgi:hypothetical protein